MEYANALEKLGLDLVEPPRLGRIMSEDAEARREIIRRLFYLITIAAEDAAALAVEGQSRRLLPEDARASAANLLELGIRIEILSSGITELTNGVAIADNIV
jgi:plasmid stabilization system protein ParE